MDGQQKDRLSKEQIEQFRADLSGTRDRAIAEITRIGLLDDLVKLRLQYMGKRAS